LKPLNIALSLIPLLAVAIGMITWVVTLRADLDVTKSDIVSLAASQSDVGPLSERLVVVETHMGSIPDTTNWRNDMSDRVITLESNIEEGYDDSELETQLQNLALENEESVTTIAWIMGEYGPAIEDLRSRELDTDLSDRLAELSREVSTVTARVDGLDISDYGNISSRLGAMETIVDTINGGEIDLTPLVTRIAELEGKVRSLPTSSNRYDDSVISRKIATLEGSISSLQTTVRNLPRGGGTSYDDSILRRQIGTLQSSVSSLESSVRTLRSSSGGTSYDDSSIRGSIRTLTSGLSSLESTVRNLPSGGTAYNDASIRASVSSLQSTLAQLQGQVSSIPTSTDYSSDIATLFTKINGIDSDLNSLSNEINNTAGSGTNEIGDIYIQIQEMKSKLEELSWTLDNNATSGSTTDITYLEGEVAQLKQEMEWLNEGLGSTFDYLFEQLIELQDTVNFLASNPPDNSTGGNNSGTSGSNTSGTPEKLYLSHSTNSNQYNGTYYLSGEYNGFPMWKCEECGATSGQFATTYLFRYPVGFTNSGWVWAVQPIPPSTDWSANSYLDAEWPWESTNWSGDVQSVTITS